MKIIIVGGGKVGYYLAKTLLEHGHDPCIIEKDKALCIRIANELDVSVICGDGTSLEVLRSAQAQQAEALVGVSGRDEDNLIACQLAKKKFNVQRTVARVNNPKNALAMKQLGVDIPISSTDNIARIIEHEIDTAAIRQLMSLNRGEASLNELQVPDHYKLSGITLKDLQLHDEAIIVLIMRAGEMIIPRGNTQIFERDKIIVIAKNSIIHDLSRMLELE